MQRAKISALNTQLQKLGIPLATIRRIATANARINELGTGRVGIQRPDVSASIIAEGLKDSDAWQIIEHVRDAMEMIGLAPQDELTQMLQEDINNFDPDGEWRSLMTARSTRVLEQMANLNLKGMRLYCPHDVSGLLENICRIFRRHGINLTAISSHVLQPEEGRTGVTFDIGLDEKCPFDVPALATDLEIIGVSEESF
jgi:DNA-binding transcriptional MerR regulator